MSIERIRVMAARGESLTDVARRIGDISGVPVASDATDEEVLDALADAAGLNSDTEAAVAEAEAAVLAAEAAAGDAQASAGHAADEADRAEAAADVAASMGGKFYSTVAAGAAATSAPDTFTSNESGVLKVYDQAGVELLEPATALAVVRAAARRPLPAILRGRKFGRRLGALLGATSSTSAEIPTISITPDVNWHLTNAADMLPTNKRNRRKITQVVSSGSASPNNKLTITCERPHGLAVGDRVVLGGNTSHATGFNTADVTQGNTNGGHQTKSPIATITPQEMLAGWGHRGIQVTAVTSDFVFETSGVAFNAFTDTDATMYWEECPCFWLMDRPPFDVVVPGRHASLPLVSPANYMPGFGIISPGAPSGLGNTAGQAPVKTYAIEFLLLDDFFMFCNIRGDYRFYADGIPLHSNLVSIDGSFLGTRTRFTFRSARPRVIRIETTEQAGHSYGIWTRSKNSIAPARIKEERRPLALMCGDSFMEGTGSGMWQQSIAALMADRLGMDVIHGSLGSTGMTTNGIYGAGSKYIDRMRFMKRAGIEPDVVFVFNTGNDGTSTTVNNATEFVQQLKQLWPHAEIVVLGRVTSSNPTPAGWSATDLYWVQVCRRFGLPFVDGGMGSLGKPNWITAGNVATYYGGTTATATASLTTGAVSSVAVTNAGAGYDPAHFNGTVLRTKGTAPLLAAPTVSFSGGGGNGAAATADMEFKVTDIQIVNPGRGYTAATLALTTGIDLLAVTQGNAVVAIHLTNRSDMVFVYPPTITISGGGGSGATAEPVLEGGRLVAVIITSGGSGYTTVPTVTVDICSGAATATATVAGGQITGVTITSQGTMYTNAPLCLVTGDGYGAELVPFISGSVTGITVTNGGSGYATPPTVTLTAPGPDAVHPKPNGHRLLAHRFCSELEQLLTGD